MRKILLALVLVLVLVMSAHAGRYFGTFGTATEVDDTCRICFPTFDTLGHSADATGDSVYFLRFVRGTLVDSTYGGTKLRNYFYCTTKKAYDGTNLGQYTVIFYWRPVKNLWYNDDGYYLVEPETVSYARGDTIQRSASTFDYTSNPVKINGGSAAACTSVVNPVKINGGSALACTSVVNPVKINGGSALACTSVVNPVTVGTNNDKSGYSLTQTFPANFSDLLISSSTGGVYVDSMGDSLITGKKIKTLTFDSSHYDMTYKHMTALYSDSGNVGGAATDWTVGEKNQIRRSLGVTGDTAILATYALPVWDGDYFSSRTITGDTYTPEVTVTTNNDKTGYSLTQTFPTNFSDLLISSDGGVYTDSIPDSLITGKKIKTLTFDSSHYDMTYKHMTALYSDSGNVGGAATDWTVGEKNQIRRSLGVTGDTASLTAYALPVWDGDYFYIRTLHDTTDTYQILFPFSGAYNKDSIQTYNSSGALTGTTIFHHNNTDAAYDTLEDNKY